MMTGYLGGRKFAGFILILGAAGLAKYFCKSGLTHEDTLFLIGAYSAFALGNVTNTLSAHFSGNGDSDDESGAPAAPTLDMAQPVAPVQNLDIEPLTVRLTEFEQETFNRLTVIESGVALQNQAIGQVLKLASGAPARPVNEVPNGDQVGNPYVVNKATENRQAVADYLRRDN